MGGACCSPPARGPGPGPAARPRRWPWETSAIRWSPDGQKVAGLDAQELVILDVAGPERQTRAVVNGLPAVFEPRAGGFAWQGDRLKVPGRAAEQEGGPYREAVLTAAIAINPATARPANR